MLSRGIAILNCFQWLVAASHFRPHPCFGSLPFRFLSSDGPNPPPHGLCKLTAKKSDCSPQQTLSETILQSLTKIAARTPPKHASPQPLEREAISEALTILGFEKYIQKFVGNPATLPFIRKIELLVTEESAHSDVKILLRRRAFLAVSLEQFAVEHKLLKSFFLTGESASKVIAQNPGILLQSVGHLERKLRCLDDFEVGKAALLRICTSSHRVLLLEPDCLKSRLAFFEKIGLTTDARDRLLRKFPQALKLSVEKNLEPTVEFFAREGMSSVAMLKMFCIHPEFLGMSIDKNLALKMDTLKQLGLTPQECCKAIPYLAHCSSQQMLTCYNALKHHFSADNVDLIIRKQPDILGISMDCFEKKLDHLINVEKRNLQEIVRFPACLGYSLEQRIVPRFNVLREKNVAWNYSLPSILAVKREVFKKRFSVPQSVKIIS